MKPEFSKPFDLAAARAGAPIGCINGLSVKIHNWAARGEQTLLLGEIVANNADVQAAWSVTGRTQRLADCFDLVMLPLGLIDGKPVFAGDAIEDGGPGDWTPGIAHPCNRDFKNCRWPAPAKVYPETTMRHEDMLTFYVDALRKLGYNAVQAETQGLDAVVNAALRHAVDAGQVMPKDEHEAALHRLGERLKGITLGDRAARDMNIAVAVRNTAYTEAMNCQSGHEGTVIRQINLAAIISTVK